MNNSRNNQHNHSNIYVHLCDKVDLLKSIVKVTMDTKVENLPLYIKRIVVEHELGLKN